ncbi:MAG: hypothetical protein IK046_02490, partial [Clostridia bacterium]|nr:hypothetical protein [Clostridia bacterium]
MADNVDGRDWTCKYDKETDTFTMETNYVALDKNGNWVPEDKIYTMVITQLDANSFSGTDDQGAIIGTRS